MKPICPTPHPDVNEILNLLLTNVKEILRDQFVGMYLYGSLANGDFDQHSDIDVLVVTDADISNDLFEALKEMHEKITKIDSPWAIQLEVSYIPQIALRRFDPANKLHPHMDRGNGEVLHRMSHDSDWIIQRSLLREQGITITGPDPASLIDPVSQEDLRWAAVEDINSWFKNFLDDPHMLQIRGYQSYTVLTLCRILHTFEHGTVISKPKAANWAKTSVDPKWIPLIENAWEGRQNPNMPASPEDLSNTLEFIRYTLGRTS